jgi:hypothetical protein
MKEENGVERDSEGYLDQVKTLLGKYGLTKICPSTCYNWLRQLGFLCQTFEYYWAVLSLKKHWVPPCGMRVLVPKDEGQGVMVSAFQSREIGFGFIMLLEQLQQVNNARRGKRYKDEEAAISRLRTAYKKDLLKSPFIKEFEYGASNEGYWCYDHMVLHFEDVVDCLITLYPQYDYLFLFDHSCGHDKQREDGLNVQKMSKLYGGKQPIMCNTVLTKEEGF